MTAIGPFATEQVVDFDDLTRGGLFLLEGPTGAGKSTILDAITFGLYGGIASDESDESRLHSDFADPEVQPRVELEFQAGGVRYRISRTPAYARPKKRGDGTTQEKPSVVLMHRKGGDWEAVSTNAKEVAQVVLQAVGLNRGQFTQVVLLPQGEFARFLKSQDDDRRNLLAEIFGTEVFERITASLKQRATVVRGTVVESEKVVGNRLHALAEAGGVSPEQTQDWNSCLKPWAPEQLVLLGQSIAQHGEELRQQLGDAADAEANHASKQAHALAGKQTQADLVSRLRDLSDLTDKKRGHEAAEPAYEERRARHKAGGQAASVAPLQRQADRMQKTVTELLRRTLDLAGGPARLSELRGQAQVVSERADDAKDTASRLDHLVVLEEQLQDRLAHIARQESGLKASKNALETIAAQAADLPEQVRDLESQEAQLRVETADTKLLEANVQSWERRLGAAESAAKLEGEAAAARDRHRFDIDQYQQAVDTHQQLVDARFADMAGELARSLRNDAPCLVCGSVAHPAPAVSKAAPVDADAIEQAAQGRASVEARRDAAKEVVRDLERKLAVAQSQSDGYSIAEAEQGDAQASEKLVAANEAQTKLATTLRKLQALADRQAELLVRTSEAELAIAKAEAALDADQSQVDLDSKQLAAATKDYATVALRVAALQAESNHLRTLSAAISELEDAESGFAQAQERAEDEAAKQGFASAAAAQVAWLPDKELTTLSEELSEYAGVGRSIQERLNDPRFADLGNVNLAEAESELRRLEQILVSASADLDAAGKTKGILESRGERFVACQADWARAVGQREQIGDEAAPLLELDVLARGQQGERHMTLTTYVLRYWFELVVVAANARLRKIAGGKYQLIRTEEAARKGARVGLGLKIWDLHTGQQRPTASLSGGETFYCSIALALGLADVVQAEAGGASLDTLFIDEGFGSMDGETLNDVMTVIDELRGNQRVVGIVSHVTELKDRISERLEVRRITESGPSQIKVVA